MLDLDLATILFQIINFLVIVALLYRLLFRPTLQKIGERTAEKERLVKATLRDQEESARLRAELEARLERSEQEASAILENAQERAESERAKVLEATEAEVARILSEAHTDAVQLRQQATSAFHDDLLDLILELTGRTIGRASPPELHDALVQQLSDRIWEMGRSEMPRVETFRRSLGDRTPTAYITTAQPLSPEQQGSLARAFTALADRRINLESRTDSSLAVGARVRLGDLIVDNTIADRLDELRLTVSEALRGQ